MRVPVLQNLQMLMRSATFLMATQVLLELLQLQMPLLLQGVLQLLLLMQLFPVAALLPEVMQPLKQAMLVLLLPPPQVKLELVVVHTSRQI